MTIQRVFSLVALCALLAAPLQATEQQAQQPTDPQMDQQTDPQTDQQMETPTGTVVRAVFTSDVVEREPSDELSHLANDTRRVFFFTELGELSGKTVIHRWEFNGKVMAEVPFDVTANRWRVWSSKTLDPLWLGEWTVSVIGMDGVVLEARSFRYAESVDAAPASPAPMADLEPEADGEGEPAR